MIKQLAFAGALLAAPLAHATDFTVTIADPSQLAGITYARTQYNATLPKDGKGDVVGALATDADYVSWVVRQAAASYASQQTKASLDAAATKAFAGDPADLKALANSLPVKSK